MADAYLAWDILLKQRRCAIAQERLRLRELQESWDPFNLSDEDFISLFRISPDMAKQLVNKLQHLLPRQRQTGISAEKQVLTAVRFYAVGSFQHLIGREYSLGLSQSSVSRCLRAVTNAINKVLLRRYIKFPKTRVERHMAREKFINAAHPFPGAIGAIGCSHMRIKVPKHNREEYLNKFDFHSLNVQMVCDPDLKILNVNAQYPGSCHESYIWTNSPARKIMQLMFDKGERAMWLIGDDEYPLEPWLMTPLKDEPPATPKYRFSEDLCKARSVVDRTFRVLKSTFRCLSAQQELQYEPEIAGRIVNACAVLHNWRIEEGLPIPLVEEEEIVIPSSERGVELDNNRIPELEALVGKSIRDEYIALFYETL